MLSGSEKQNGVALYKDLDLAEAEIVLRTDLGLKSIVVREFCFKYLSSICIFYRIPGKLIRQQPMMPYLGYNNDYIHRKKFL